MDITQASEKRNKFLKNPSYNKYSKSVLALTQSYVQELTTLQAEFFKSVENDAVFSDADIINLSYSDIIGSIHQMHIYAVSEFSFLKDGTDKESAFTLHKKLLNNLDVNGKELIPSRLKFLMEANKELRSNERTKKS